MKLGALGLPAYRTFSLEELEEATNNFDTSAFIGEGCQGQVLILHLIERERKKFLRFFLNLTYFVLSDVQGSAEGWFLCCH